MALLDKSVAIGELKQFAGQALTTPNATVRQLACHPNGRYVAGATADRVVIWDTEKLGIAAELVTGDVSLSSLAWNPNRNTLAAAGNDGCVWGWNDPESRRFGVEPDFKIQLGPQHGLVKRVFWSPEGRHILTVNGNGTIAVIRLGRQEQ